ncbi:MAG: hypothetical protein Q9222_007888 [Ikaeria aurantiellina]
MRACFVFLFALFGLSASALLHQERLDERGLETRSNSHSWFSKWTCGWTNSCTGFLYSKTTTNGSAKAEKGGQGKQSASKNDIPDYVLEYAPLVHLYSGEQFWPCDIAEHLQHVTPYLNYTPIGPTSNNLNLSNLDQLNEYTNGRFVYLTSDDNVEARPDWLGGEKNIPGDPEEEDSDHDPPPTGSRDSAQQILDRNVRATQQIRGGRSDAPAVLIVVNKGHGIVDAFWFFFYSYNLGNLVFNIRFGNHVGDWEHSLVRFEHGKPKYVFVSEHYFGEAYTYDAVEKIGKRVRSLLM